MHRFLLAMATYLLAIPVLAQTQPMNQTTHDWISLSKAPVPQQTGVLFGFDLHKKQVLGTPYEDSTFRAGNIRFYGKLPGSSVDSLMGVAIRHDVYEHRVEINASPTDIRVVDAPRIRQFAMNNVLRQSVDYFVNTREFRGEADQLSGFFEVLVPGKAMLLRYPSVRVKKADYNAALNVGSKDDELIPKQTWYVAIDGRKAVEFSPSKKALLTLFADKEAAMETYLKTQKPDLKSRAGLIAVFGYYNGL